METSVHGITALSAVYEVDGRRFEIGSPGFAEAIADAHASHQRPRCMCLVEGVEMYIARLGDGYIVKRMPNAGSRHAPDCPSYEPPAEFSGLGQVLGTAITEDPATGETTLKLDFSLSKIPGRSTVPSAGGNSDSVATDGTRLSLRGLLHYLWDQAELTRWQPSFAGKRTWGTVRKHLLLAATNKIARGDPLRSRLFVPEVFSVDQRDAINARRVVQWAQAVASPGRPQHLMLLVGEVKEIVPARYGFKVVVKHVPDQAFALDESLYRRIVKRFERELSLWAASDRLHMVVGATFGVNGAGVPTVAELSLMPTNEQWVPIEDSFALCLVDLLVHSGRWFQKSLRYNLSSEQALATAVLLDTVSSPCPLYIARSGMTVDWPGVFGGEGTPSWVWEVGSALPTLPSR